MRVERQWPGREADRGDDSNLDFRLCGERARLPLDEHAERRPLPRREQSRQGEDPEHRPFAYAQSIKPAFIRFSVYRPAPMSLGLLPSLR